MLTHFLQAVLLVHLFIFSHTLASETGPSTIEREVRPPVQHPALQQHQQHSGVGQPGHNVRQRGARLNRNESTASVNSQPTPPRAAARNAPAPRQGGNRLNVRPQRQTIGDTAYRTGRVVEHVKNAGHNMGVAAVYGVGAPVAGAIGAVVSPAKAARHFQSGREYDGRKELVHTIGRPIDATVNAVVRAPYHTALAASDLGKATKHVGRYVRDKKDFSGESDRQRLIRQRENRTKLEHAQRKGTERRQVIRNEMKHDFQYFSGMKHHDD